MANFKNAFDKTLLNEGFYSNNPNDKGKETVYGIARAYNPDCFIWKFVDECRGKPNFPNNIKSDPNVMSGVMAWYKKNYWDCMSLDAMLDQLSAEEVFDTAVNSGVGFEANGFQLAVWLLGNDIVLDGKVGVGTIAAADKCDDKKLLQMLNLIQGRKYIDICLKDPSQRVFMKGGWIDRTITNK